MLMKRQLASRMVATLCACTLSLVAADRQPQRSAPPSAERLPTGISITPLAARGVTLQPLNPDLPDLPQFTADHPLTTALSPDGKTLLVVTSGFNRVTDIRGRPVLAQSNEYVFVYGVSRGGALVKQQAL